MQRLLDLVVLTECPGVASCQWAGAHRIQCLPRGWDEDLGVVCIEGARRGSLGSVLTEET